MYAKVKTVRRGGRRYEYLELVEGRREGTRVRQHVVANLGRLDELKAGGKLEQLVPRLARLDQPPPGSRRHVGPLLIAAHYLRRLGVAEVVNAAVPRRGKALASHGEIACVLAASRLASPSPLYDIAGWASSAAVPELLGTPAVLLNDDRLGRSLEALAGVAEDVRGQLMLTAVREFPGVADASRLHLDLTAVRFAGQYPGSDLAEKGWAADRTIGRPVKTLQASGPAGGALYFRPPKGSASELPAFMAAPGAPAARQGRRAAYIGSSEEAASVAAARERALARAEAALTRVRNGLGGRSCKTRKQVDARVAQILTGPVKDLLAVRTATKAGKPVITWARDTAAITAASQLDGLYALAANLPDHPAGPPLTALDVLEIYKDQWIAQQRHRDLKQTLRVRPVFLHNDDRIQALIAVIGIALLIFGLIEAELRAALGPGVPLPGILPEHRAAIPTARAALAAFDGLHLTYTPVGPVLDHLTSVQRTILALLNIPLPWPEKPN